MKNVLLVGLMVLVVGALIGCGVKTEVTRYYWGPSWTRDGKVILVGATETKDKDVLGSQLDSSYSEYVMTVYPSGTGESPALFETTDEPVYAMSCSPVSDYVAYMTNLRNGLFRKLIIRNIASGTHTGLEVVELSFSPGIKAFDWSSDGTKLVYCTTQEIRTVDIDGANDTLVTSEDGLQFVSWKYGSRIAFYRESPSEEGAVIYADGSGRRSLGALAAPQVSSSNTDEVWGINSIGTGLYTVDLTVFPTTLTLYDTFADAVVLPRLSPDAASLTYSRSGEASGVYLYTIAAKTESTVKK